MKLPGPPRRPPHGVATLLLLTGAMVLLVVGATGLSGTAVALPVSIAAVGAMVLGFRPRGAAWAWVLVGSVAWTAEEALWTLRRLADWSPPSLLGGVLDLTDVCYLVGSVAWLVAMARLPHVKWPRWTLSGLPALVVLALLLSRMPSLTAATSFPILDVMLAVATLPALEGALRGRAGDGRLLWTLGFFVRAFSSANFAWLSDMHDGFAPYFEMWLLGYVLIALGVWFELRDDQRGVWPATTLFLALQSVIFVTTTALFELGLSAQDRLLLFATLGYVELLGIVVILLGDRRRRLKAEADLDGWTGLMRRMARLDVPPTQVERPLEGLFREARQMLPQLRGLSAYGDPPLQLGALDGYAYPLVREGAEIGHLHFARQPDGSVLLDALAPLLTHQIVQMRQHAAWLEHATTDPLTGLRNRRGFEVDLGRLLARGAAQSDGLLVAMLDLDHFKRVNDLHGHPFGDSILVLLAKLLREHVRDGDLLVRWGGEEFLIVAASVGEREGRAMLGRLRKALRDATPEPLAQPLTFSAGVSIAPMPEGASEAYEQIAEADAALLRAKRAGRDTLVLSPVREAEEER